MNRQKALGFFISDDVRLYDFYHESSDVKSLTMLEAQAEYPELRHITTFDKGIKVFGPEVVFEVIKLYHKTGSMTDEYQGLSWKLLETNFPNLLESCLEAMKAGVIRVLELSSFDHTRKAAGNFVELAMRKDSPYDIVLWSGRIERLYVPNKLFVEKGSPLHSIHTYHHFSVEGKITHSEFVFAHEVLKLLGDYEKKSYKDIEGWYLTQV